MLRGVWRRRRLGTEAWVWVGEWGAKRPLISMVVLPAAMAHCSAQKIAGDADDGHGTCRRDHVETEAEFHVNAASFVERICLEVGGHLFNNQVAQSVDDNAEYN